MNGAMQGDQVLVELPRRGPTAGNSGRIARVLSRRNPTVVGIFHYALHEHAPGKYGDPFDERMTQPILIPFGEQAPAADGGNPAPRARREYGLTPKRFIETAQDLEGMVVDVEITDWPTPSRPARGRVIEVLGRRRRFRR